jgi:hypothetical protein
MVLLAAALVVWVLVSNLPALGGPRMPSGLQESLQSRYITCVSDTAIWPGEPRQPECGQFKLTVVGEGIIPAAEAASGVSKAICFRLSYTTPAWTTQGTTRHEIIEHGRNLSKVALYQDGAWSVNPDEDQADQALWGAYACAGEYESGEFNP